MLWPIVALASLFHLAFGLAVWRRNNGLADVFWGLGFITVAITATLVSGSTSVRTWLVLLLVVCWGVRLAVHIGRRNWGKGEDYRYREWREQWGRWWLLRTYLQVFVLQGCLLVAIALPLWWLPFQTSGQLGIWDVVGAMIWLVGFGFEAVGDWQLTQFKKNPANKGQLMTAGLWRYTRHPNYFGEATMWWGIAVIAWSGGLGVWSLVSPVTITWLLTQVSGIPLLEKKYLGRPDFERYRQQTSAFIPWFPKQL